MSEQILDRSVTEDIEDDFLEVIYKSYINGGSQSLDKVNTGFANGDLQRVNFGAHKLKGSSIGIGARKVAALAETIEKEAEAHNPNLEAQIKELNNAFGELKEHLASGGYKG